MFKQRLKEMRTRRGFTQVGLSRMLGISQQAVGKWETGRCTPDPQTLARLASILDTTVDYLLGGNSSGVGECMVPVLGGGIDVVYPAENRWLYEDVAAAGALISEYPPGTENKGEHFPVRNRIISGLSLGVAAVEAEEHSGTMITMRLALDQGRDAFAVPGNADAPMSRGTNLLIQRGEAKLVLSGWDILCEYERLLPGRVSRPEPLSAGEETARLEAPDSPQEQDVPEAAAAETVDKSEKMAYITLEDGALTDDERALLLALEGRELRTDDLVELTQIPARRVSSALTMLQIHGYVEEKAGRRFACAVALKRE